jgi:GNAT superfamily N-acetyltransferase
MRRELPGGYELDDDPRRIDVDAVHDYLADVYVLEEHRGHGLGFKLVRETIEGSPFSEIRWVLGTLDAQEFYGKFGFGPTSDLMERPRAE